MRPSDPLTNDRDTDSHQRERLSKNFFDTASKLVSSKERAERSGRAVDYFRGNRLAACGVGSSDA
jgi:hypothetical protein